LDYLNAKMVVTADVCNGSEEFIIIGACTYYVIKHLYSTFLHKKCQNMVRPSNYF